MAYKNKGPKKNERMNRISGGFALSNQDCFSHIVLDGNGVCVGWIDEYTSNFFQVRYAAGDMYRDKTRYTTKEAALAVIPVA